MATSMTTSCQRFFLKQWKLKESVRVLFKLMYLQVTKKIQIRHYYVMLNKIGKLSMVF